MKRIDSLELRRTTALSHALRTDCSETRSRHEEQARACGKIIDSLRRKDREAISRQRT
jgi:hypothetical protein